jgi:hypothetical protein
MPSRSSQQRLSIQPPAFAKAAARQSSRRPLVPSEDWWASGLEMTLVGVIEAVVTYGLGLAFGAMA